MTIGFLQLLLLIIIANGAPVLMCMLLRRRLDTAVDFGTRMADGNPIFGTSKTWRGVFAAVLISPLAAVIFSHTVETGILIAIGTISGDLFSSFLKRRLGMKPSSKAPLLDQIPESLIPALLVMHIFNLLLLDVIFLVFVFTFIDIIFTYFLRH